MNADPKPFFVVSDLHLGAVPRTTERSFREFLDYAKHEASGLLINGDLFDVWLASRHFVVRDHIRVLAAIADVVESGVPVYFVGGNHDALEFGGEVLRDDLGVILLEEPARVTLGPFNALVIHGDGVEVAAPQYRKRHRLLRSRSFRWVAQRVAHLDRIYERVAKWSGTPRIVDQYLRGQSTGPKPFASLIEQWARDALRQDRSVDIVLAGHSHLPARIEAEPGRYYVNSGDWISHMTYVVLAAKATPPEIRRWPERAIYVTGEEARATALGTAS
jgi:UDP-2,3-diacylglucosamine pyrophosphatase LpxH